MEVRDKVVWIGFIGLRVLKTALSDPITAKGPGAQCLCGMPLYIFAVLPFRDDCFVHPCRLARVLACYLFPSGFRIVCWMYASSSPQCGDLILMVVAMSEQVQESPRLQVLSSFWFARYCSFGTEILRQEA